MGSIIGAILSVAVKGLMAFFLPSKDEKLGQSEQRNADLEASNEALSNRPVTNDDLVRVLTTKADNER